MCATSHSIRSAGGRMPVSGAESVPADSLPPGPRYPAAIQMVGFWTRPLAFLERCRARYGGRFTIRLPLAPPFVMLTDPGEVKAVCTAQPDVLHPGEGAKVLEPVRGRHSVILLDADAHMEQRKLMLPAFHGERIDERRREGQERDDVLALLLTAAHEDGSPMSEHELCDELMTLLVAGHETTASSLAWGFDRLAGRPEVVDRLRHDSDDAYLTA